MSCYVFFRSNHRKMIFFLIQVIFVLFLLKFFAGKQCIQFLTEVDCDIFALENHEGAIQVIRDSFLAWYFSAPLPHMTFYFLK